MNVKKIEDLRLQRQARFHMILEWEEKRNTETSLYLSLLHEVISRILHKLSNSQEANIAVLRYLKDKSMSLHTFSASLLSELIFLPNPTISQRKGSLVSGLASIAKYQQQLSGSFSDLSQNIQ